MSHRAHTTEYDTGSIPGGGILENVYGSGSNSTSLATLPAADPFSSSGLER